MFENLTGIRQKVSGLRPWIIVAGLVMLALAGYYTVLAFEYTSSSGQLDTIQGDLNRMSAGIQQETPDVESVAAELELANQRLQELYGVFNHYERHDLVAIASKAAQEAGASLEFMTFSDSDVTTRQSVQFKTQPMSIGLRGNPTNIYQAISLIHQEVPSAAIADLRIFNLDSSPLAEIQMILFEPLSQVTSGVEETS